MASCEDAFPPCEILELRDPSNMRALYRQIVDRIRAIRPAVPRGHCPDLSDAYLIRALAPQSSVLRRAKEHLAQGDRNGARSCVVDHFAQCVGERFFCSGDRIRSMCASIRRDHPTWVDALRSRVEADLSVGLHEISRHRAPLSRGYDWTCLPLGPGNDDLYLAQPHRFGFMPGLALAAHHGMPTLSIVHSTLSGWLLATESGERSGYFSPLVVLYRVLSLTWTFVFVEALQSTSDPMIHEVLFAIVKILHADAEYLRSTIGDSYPNNHLLADGFAGWFCGVIFREFPHAEESKFRGDEIFRRELMRQFYEDGTSFEHSTHYHEMGCEMVVAYLLLSRRNRLPIRSDIITRAHRMLAFQVALSGPEAIPLHVGDATEDPLFPLDTGHGWAPGAMREFYRALFDERVTAAPRQDSSIERAYWMLGGALRDADESEPEAAETDFAQGGFHVLHDTAKNARLTFRSGPAAGLPISAGHAHADLLCVYLSVGNVAVIVDAGTFTYRASRRGWPAGSPQWRAYFAGPASHNGPFAGADPYGTLQGDFRGREVPCRIRSNRLRRSPGLAWLEFEVVGHGASTGHRRGVVHVEGMYWLVYDVLPVSISTRRAPSIGLQFAERTRIDGADRKLTFDAAVGSERCRVALSPDFEAPGILCGSTTPLGGWVSPRYGEVVAAPQLRSLLRREAKSGGFVLQVDADDSEKVDVAAAVTSQEWLGFRLVGDGFEDVVMLATGDDVGAMTAWGIDFRGSLIWIRRRENGVVDQRSFDLEDVVLHPGRSSVQCA
jgi:hypothetical protein